MHVRADFLFTSIEHDFMIFLHSQMYNEHNAMKLHHSKQFAQMC